MSLSKSELTDAQIDAVWQRMNGDTEWLRTFGYQQFAQAILDAVAPAQDSSAAPCADPIVERNVSLLRQRSAIGVQKYGTTLADNKLPLRAWLNHALEEALDQANYLQAAMAEIDSAERALPPLPEYFPLLSHIRSDEEARAKLYAEDYARSAITAAPGQAGHFPQRDQSKPTEQQGIFQKFDVRRTDGSSAPGGKHHDCRYFVLDVDHDALAKPALQAYAAVCAATHPDLSADMVKRFDLAPAQAQEPVPEAAQQNGGIVRAALADLLALERHALAGALNFEAQADCRVRFARARQALSAPVQTVAVPDDLDMQTIRERDYNAEIADKLAEAISKHFGIDIGEHSNMNCPWHEALEAIENATPAMWAALNMSGKAVCVNQDKSACDVERLCIKTPTTIAPLYVGASEPQ